jgi:hypothetical protein
MPVRSQAVTDSSSSKTAANTQVKTVNGSKTVQKTGGPSKLNVNQQTLRQQNAGATNGSGKKADTLTPSAYCHGKVANKQVTKGSPNNQLTPPPPGGNQQITKGNQQVTKGSNQQVTKGSAVQTTAAASPK